MASQSGRRALVLVLGLGCVGLAREQHGDDADRDQARHDHVAGQPAARAGQARPLQQRDQLERAGRRDQQRDAIAGDIVGHAGGELRWLQALDAEGIDDDVLARRGDGDGDGEGRGQQRARRRLVEAERDDREDQRGLSGEQPSAAAAEQARQPRQADRIDERRPQKLQHIGQADQREQPDRGQRHPVFLEPNRQRLSGERERQPAREAEEQDGEDARPGVDAEPREPRGDRLSDRRPSPNGRRHQRPRLPRRRNASPRPAPHSRKPRRR